MSVRMVKPLIAVLLMVLMLGGCGNADKDAKSPADGMTMRVYTVAPERAQDLTNGLNQALALSESNALGRASLAADGQGKIIVLAPDALHASIEASLKEVAGDLAVSSARGDAQLRLQLWSVDAMPGEGEDSSGLAGIKGALDELRKQRGPAHFVLRDQIESVSTDDEEVKRTWKVHQPYAGGPMAQQSLSYRIFRQQGVRKIFLAYDDANVPSQSPADARYSRATNIRTATAVVTGQTLVLASQPLPGTAESPADITRYYIIRIDELGAD